jgi:hypothetical protein
MLRLPVCVLTVDSFEPGTPMADFLVFSPRWDVASHTFRPPYFHRNAASEFMGLIMGDYGGRSDDFMPGGASYEVCSPVPGQGMTRELTWAYLQCGFTPHGVDYEVFKAASEIEQNGAQWISDGAYGALLCDTLTVDAIADMTPRAQPSCSSPLVRSLLPTGPSTRAERSTTTRFVFLSSPPPGRASN